MSESYPLLTVEQALGQVLEGLRPLAAVQAPILDALGSVLAEDIYAEGDIPPLDNSAMDGYALRAADTLQASPQEPACLQVIYSLAAGYVPAAEVKAGTAVRIMTGAPVPRGADAVVPFEEAMTDGEHVLLVRPHHAGQNIRRSGEDVRRGALVIPRGRDLRPQEVGMLAALGRTAVQVTRRPQVGILATGDEVIAIDAPWEPGKIRNANSYANAAQVSRCGGVPLLLGIARDDPGALTDQVHQALAQGIDMLITSGGISVGDFDIVKKVLAAEGEIRFWQVRMRPGKPLAFGYVDGVPLLGLPGNPVAAMVSFVLYARPAIQKMMGKVALGAASVRATLLEDIRVKPGFRHYLRVMLEERDGQPCARMTGEQGSGILLSMVRAQGLAVIPEDTTAMRAGEQVEVLLLD